MGDREWVYWRNLKPDEAAQMIEGVKVEADVEEQDFSGDIILNFRLPDGNLVEYRAEHESDYYGGTYCRVTWSLYRGAEQPPGSTGETT